MAIAVVLTVSLVGLVSCATLRNPGAAVSPSPTASASPSADPQESTAPETPAPTPTPANTEAVAPVSGGDVTVVVVTLDAVSGRVEASGMIPTLSEDGGRCTLTLKRGELVRTAEVEATAAREATYCGLVTIPVTDLGPGQWTAVLSYVSASHSGVSAEKTVNVS
ncbi:hypothetical protein DEU37_2225 [Microbacterium sp. AG790]|uniref:hypothetical protein n=1 Tax=Microbacterium sp. AG790 TaxID=2183995 RepID=UPI000F1C0E29|nr:hypothetical protein [Microbacterium sp. AG790]RKS88604.1 hypothetical protein DEU37_2225 [Microbacterium sp. AG790]